MNEPVVPILDLKAQLRAIEAPVRAAIERIVTSQQFILGAEVEAFEAAIAEYLGVEHAVGVASGTDALVLALLALDIGPGDGVVTTPMTYIATAEAIARVGARPVFADVREDDLNLSVESLEQILASPPPGVRLRAIMPVHLYGRACQIGKIVSLAQQHDLFVIEDTAQALGALKHGRRAGTFGDVGCYSFFPSKNLGAFGDGGLVTTRDAARAQRLRQLRMHGQKTRYVHEELGLNSRLDALQAAILGVKLPHLDAWNDGRRRHARHYREALYGTPLRLLTEDGGGRRDIFHLFVARAPDRDALVQHLHANGVQAVVHYPVPVHLQPCFAPLGYRRGDLPVAEAACDEVVSLPIYAEMTDAQRAHVVHAVRAFYGV